MVAARVVEVHQGTVAVTVAMAAERLEEMEAVGARPAAPVGSTEEREVTAAAGATVREMAVDWGVGSTEVVAMVREVWATVGAVVTEAARVVVVTVVARAAVRAAEARAAARAVEATARRTPRTGSAR